MLIPASGSSTLLSASRTASSSMQPTLANFASRPLMCIKNTAAPGPYRTAMHFMFLILAFLLCAVVWGFFHANPRGVNERPLAQKPDHKALAAYLGVMAGGTTFMIVVASGGLIRNLFLFPLGKRGQDPFSVCASGKGS